MGYIGSTQGILPIYIIQSTIPPPEIKTPCFSAPSLPARLIPKLKKLLPLQMESPGHSRSSTTVGGIFKEPWVCPRAAAQHWRGRPITSKNTESRHQLPLVSQMGCTIFPMSLAVQQTPLSLKTALSDASSGTENSYKDNIPPCEFQSSCRKPKLIVFQHYFHFLLMIPVQQSI